MMGEFRSGAERLLERVDGIYLAGPYCRQQSFRAPKQFPTVTFGKLATVPRLLARTRAPMLLLQCQLARAAVTLTNPSRRYRCR